MFDGIEKRDNGVVVRLSGMVDTAQIRQANEACYELRETAGYDYEIFHFSDIEDFQISTSELRAVAERDVQVSNAFPIKKLALVSDSTLVFGVARMYEVFAEDLKEETMVFKTMEEAERWVAT